MKRLLKNKSVLFGSFLIGTLFLISILGPLLIGPAGLDINLDYDLKGPSSGRLGFGENGIDVLTWLVYGARISLWVALVTTVLSLLIGLLYGVCAGLTGGRIDNLMMRIIDVLLAFPGTLLAIYIAAVLRPSLTNVIFALCATGWVGYARLARAQVLALKNRDYVTAAQSLGAGPIRVAFFHILPNLMGPIVVQATFGISSIILAEATLSFLGLGVPPGTPSWGALLDQGVANLFIAPHLIVFPGICIALSVLGFNFLGDGLRDVLDTKAR